MNHGDHGDHGKIDGFDDPSSPVFPVAELSESFLVRFMKNQFPMDMRIPTATYRLQFNHLFTLSQATSIVDYLNELGISDIYSSPILKARQGSLHGYDVTDHSRLNPELGGREQFEVLSDALRDHGMGLVMDVVPNHMCVAGNENQWWLDIMENGPGSPFAGFLDIDWHPLKASLTNRVLLPVLGDQFGRVLEDQQIKLAYRRGAFTANYYETKLPIDPRASIPVLTKVLKIIEPSLGEQQPQTIELESIITALTHLPSRDETDADRVKERRREKEIIRRRLSALFTSSVDIRRAIEGVIDEYNGVKGNERSFDGMEELLNAQAYHLCYWRVAADEINYRRFFDVNELAAIRIEESKVFAAVHELIFRLIKEGSVTGLRLDHIDGLLDPEQYLRDLQRHVQKALRRAQSEAGQGLTRGRRRSADATQLFYLVVEKILGHDEKLRDNWASHSTTGYDFLNLLNGVFVEVNNDKPFRKLYQRFTGLNVDFDDLAYRCKKLILQVAMSSELLVLAKRLERISDQHRYSRDFTLNSLQAALAEMIACFPVYRSYLCPHLSEINEEDRRHINTANLRAKRRNPAVSPSIFDFIKSLLLLDDPTGINEEQRAERREFVFRLQQLTGPVTAKGVEDTAFYRCYPLASLCEVGGEPSQFGVTIERFHRHNELRQSRWPHSMLATSTHDTKRSEDVRARINVLSEIPARWYRAARRWKKLNQAHKTQIEGCPAPDANDEYLVYQTLVGTWPFKPLDAESQQGYIARIQEYMVKALREAKTHSSWINPNEEYEQATRIFVRKITASPDFVDDFIEFHKPVARAGIFNSLSQTLLKTTSPGLPDFYQGTEVWDFRLVDPDNRTPVDYGQRREILDALRAVKEEDRRSLASDLIDNAEDGRIKFYLTQRSLGLRRNRRELFKMGDYHALTADGDQARHVISFARSLEDEAVIVVTTRFFTGLVADGSLPVGREVWGETAIKLSDELAGCYRDVLTGQTFCAQSETDEVRLRLAEVCAVLPVVLLERFGNASVGGSS